MDVMDQQQNQPKLKSLLQWKYLAMLLLVSLFLWDIGNILAPRQGTESLYVQISKEMYEKQSFVTPIYRGEAHWSKPPLQYWLPMPLYYLSGGFSLAAARSSMAIMSIFSLSLLLFFLSRLGEKLDFTKSAMIFLASFGVLKFSRIFMMEIPLALMPLVGSVGFYYYLQTKKTRYLLLSSLFIGLGGLVKGPVSLAMGFASIGLFGLVQHVYFEKNHLKSILNLVGLSLLISSIWYFICLKQYGTEFFNYFFLRENLGKFGQESSMSPLKIVQGLFIYTFPWFHLVRFGPKTINSRVKDPLFCYLLIHFFIFFIIWFIPSQKSHHYAMPSFAFWITLILINPQSMTRNKISRFLFWIQVGALLLLSSLFLYFSNTLIELALALTPIVVLLFSIKMKQSTYGIAISFVALFTTIIVRFFLPLVPSDRIEKLMTDPARNIYYNDRRPFFLEQRLNRKVKLYGPGKAIRGDLIMGTQARLNLIAEQNLKNVGVWDKWKRKVTKKEVYLALIKRDLSYLKSSYHLLQVK